LTWGRFDWKAFSLNAPSMYGVNKDLKIDVYGKRHVFTKTINLDLTFEVNVWRINFILELIQGLVVVKA
jgi:hypothetical protein